MCVEIHVTAGPAKGKSFLFEKPGRLLFGRADDAHILIPNDRYISRHHFELEIHPPTCILRDLNSTNGVFVNGIHYGGRIPLHAGIEQAPRDIKEIPLHDGDEIAVRETRIKVSIRSASRDYPPTEIFIHPKSAEITNKEIALFVLNIPQSTQQILSGGETQLSPLVGSILAKIKQHSSSPSLLLLKYINDGFLMAFPTISEALSLALMLLELSKQLQIRVYMALHWGIVKIRADGDIFGREVHRVYRIEGVQSPEQIHSAPSGEPLPVDNRILITEEGLGQINDSKRERFRSVGTFQLKGFEEACPLWVLSEGE
jgi:class 3 adenylate cyclase